MWFILYMYEYMSQLMHLRINFNCKLFFLKLYPATVLPYSAVQILTVDSWQLAVVYGFYIGGGVGVIPTFSYFHFIFVHTPKKSRGGGCAATPLLVNFLHVDLRIFFAKSEPPPPTMLRACIYACMHMRWSCVHVNTLNREYASPVTWLRKLPGRSSANISQ